MRPGEAERLAGMLGRGTAAERASAVARLRLLGRRAIDPVLAALARGEEARLDTLEVLAGLEEPRAVEAALGLVSDPSPQVAARAVELARERPGAAAVSALSQAARSAPPALRAAAVRSLAALFGGGCVEALDPLVGVALAPGSDEPSRAAALAAVRTLPKAEAEAILARVPGGAPLRGEISPNLERLHAGLSSADPGPHLRRLAEEAARIGSPTSIPALHSVLSRLGPAGAGGSAAEARAHVHLALAALDSRVALYDLRESLEARPASAPATLLRAAAIVGDASLVPALSRIAREDPGLRGAAALALAGVRGREGLRRDRARARVAERDREAFEDLWKRATALLPPRGSPARGRG